MSEYADRLPWDLEPHYSKHVSAMTAENLLNKADIAAELAYRDQVIERLTRELEAVRPDAERYRFLTSKRLGWFGHFSPAPFGKESEKDCFDRVLDAAMKGGGDG